MESRAVLTWAACASLVLLVADGTARGQGKVRQWIDEDITEELSFLADFRTLYECLERVARDDALIVNFRSITMQWPGEKGSQVLWYERSFPSQERRILAHGVPRTLSDSHGHTEIFFNIETGELMGPEGVPFKDLQIPMVELRLSLTRPDKEPYLVTLAREFPDRRIKASIGRIKALIVSEEEDKRAVLLDLLASLESKLKLAAKLREARKRRGQDATGETKMNPFAPMLPRGYCGPAPKRFDRGFQTSREIRELTLGSNAVFPAGIAAANVLGFTTQNPAHLQLILICVPLSKSLWSLFSPLRCTSPASVTFVSLRSSCPSFHESTAERFDEPPAS